METSRSPIEFSVDREAGVRLAAFCGVVTDADLMEAYESLLGDPAYDPTLHDFVDMSGVERLEISANAIRELIKRYARVDELGIRTKLAIFAPSDVAFGMGRMYEMLRGDDVPEEIRVFREHARARSWLSE